MAQQAEIDEMGPEEKKRARRAQTGIAVVLIILTIIGALLLYQAVNTRGILGIVLGLILIGVPAKLLLGGLKIVQRPDKWVIEYLGHYYTTFDTGVHWICPFLVKVRAIIPGWLRSIELFKEEPFVDFKEGGTAVLVEPTLWLRVTDVEKAIYMVSNWQTAARELTESFLKSLLGSLTVEKTITKVYYRKTSWWELLAEKYPDLVESFDNWGLVGEKITITDFEWGDEVVKERQAVFQAAKRVEVAAFMAKAAESDAGREALMIGGVIGRIKEALIKDLGYTKKKAEELAPKIFSFVKAADTGSLFLTSLGKEDGFGPLIAQVISIMGKTQEKMQKTS